MKTAMRFCIFASKKEAFAFYYDWIENHWHARLRNLKPWHLKKPVDLDDLRRCVNYLFDSDVVRDHPQDRDRLINKNLIPIASVNTGVSPVYPNWTSRINVYEKFESDLWEGEIRLAASPQQEKLLRLNGFEPDKLGIPIPAGNRDAVFDHFRQGLLEVWQWDVKKKLKELGLE